MEVADAALLSALLAALLSALPAALYIFPTLWLTSLRVTESLERAAGHDPPRWWVAVPSACLTVGVLLSLALYAFYLVFVDPLLVDGLCHPFWQGVRASVLGRR
ncbi:hypothetical protein F4825DRAFT_454858 [Nemania diffusa]|nr:hypothetical protein F4825DRAFT_454858 [Nemania diffusa]